MKIARNRILAYLVYGALILGGPAMGQQTGTVRQREPYQPIETDATQAATLDGPESSGVSSILGPSGACGWQPEGPGMAGMDACPPPPQCCEVCGGGGCYAPRFYVEQGIRILNRSRPREISLTADVLNIRAGQPDMTVVQGTSAFVLPTPDNMNTHSMFFGLSPGYELTLGGYLGRDSCDRDDYLEFTYWGLNRWHTCMQYNGRNLPDEAAPNLVWGSLFSPFPTSIGGFNRVQIHTQEYSSENHSFEWDLRLTPRGRPDRLVLQPNGKWRRECQPGRYISYLFGLRYMMVNDSFAFRGRGTINDAGSLRDVSGDYLVFSHNNLIGLQLGADLCWRRCRWDFGIRGKVVPSVNYADQSSEISTRALGRDPLVTGSDLAIHRHAAKDEAALIADVGFFADYKITPHLIAHAGWDFMWLTGLALAPEQLDFRAAPLNLVNAQGSIFMQGLTLQAELAW